MAATGVTVGSVWVDVLPSLRDFGGSLAQQAAKAGTKAGKAAGTSTGKALVDETDKAVRGSTGRLATALMPLNRAFNATFSRAETLATGAGSRIGRVIGSGAVMALGPLGRMRDGFVSSAAAASRFSGFAGTIGGKLRVGFDLAAKGASGIATGFRRMADDATSGVGRSSGALRSMLGILGSVAAAAGLWAVGRSAVAAAADIQRSRAALVGLYGDAGKADDMLRRLREVARASPIEFSAFRAGAESLAYMGYEGDQAVKVLQRIETAMVASGKGGDAFQAVTDAMLSMVNQGKAYAQDINRMSQAGFPAWEMLADHMGLSITDVRTAVTESKVSIEDMIGAMEKGGGPTFQKMLKAQQEGAKTFSATWARVKDNVVVSLAEMAAPLLQQFTPAIDKAGQFLTQTFTAIPGLLARVGESFEARGIPDMLRNFGQGLRDSGVLDTLQNIARGVRDFTAGMLSVAKGAGVVFVAAFVAAFNALNPVADLLSWVGNLFREHAALAETLGAAIAGAVTALVAVRTAVRAWTIAQAALNVVLAANPLALVVLAIGALVAGLVYAWKNSETFRSIVIGAWNSIKAAVAAVWTGFLRPTFAAIRTAFSAIGTAAVWLWQNAISPVFSAISLAARILAAVVFTVLVAPTLIAWNLLATAAVALWHYAIRPAFEGIAWVAGWLWSAALAPAFRFIGAGIRVVGDAAVWLWRKAVEPAAAGIGAALNFLWTGIIRPVVDFVVAYWRMLGNVVLWLWRNVAQPAFAGIGAALNFLWTGIIRPVVDAIVAYWRMWAGVLTWLWRNVAEPAFRGVGSVIRVVWDTVIRPAFDAIKGGVRAVGDGFAAAVDFIGRQWDRIKGIAAVPVNFVINQVYNRGIRAAWNMIAGYVNLPGLPEVAPLRWAGGGVFGGYAPGIDSIHARLSPGESVLVPELTAAIGAENIIAANRAASGRPASSSSAYAGGGLPSRRRRSHAGRRLDPLEMLLGGDLSEPGEGFAGGGVAAGLSFARSQAGKPYVWGGVGPGGYDCSGFMSAVANALLGLNPYSRRFATGAFAPGRGAGDMVPGLNSAFGVGVVRGNPGHMAGTLAGLNVESRGGEGVVIGPRARGARHPLFTMQFSLPQVGGQFVGGGGGGGGFDPLGWLRGLFSDALGAAGRLVPTLGDSALNRQVARFPVSAVDHVIDWAKDRVGGWFGFDQGGYLPPGLSLVDNATGRPEPVLTDAQWQALAQNRASADPPTVVNVYPREAQDEQSVAEMVARRQRIARRTRVPL